MLDVVSQQLFAIAEAFPRFKDLALDPLKPSAEARGALLFSGPLKMLQARACPPRHPHVTPQSLVVAVTDHQTPPSSLSLSLSLLLPLPLRLPLSLPPSLWPACSLARSLAHSVWLFCLRRRSRW